MNEAPKKKLSREEIANIEIGHTQVGMAQQWTLTLFFLLTIAVYPICQCFYRLPFTEWRNTGDIRQSIKNYESAIEESSLLRKWLLPPAQTVMTGLFRLGNEKVIVGKDGWLFFSGDYEYLINPGFLRPEVLARREKKGVQPDPVKGVLDFARQLKERGIRLILLPVPGKPAICSEALNGGPAPLQNPSFAEFRRQVEAGGVTVLDLTEDLAAFRRTGHEPFLRTDTHWTPEGMLLAARRLSKEITGQERDPHPVRSTQITHLGDTAAMLKLPECERFFPAETVTVADYDARPRRDSEILLLGDSFANIYSAEVMQWGTDGGLAEALGSLTGSPVDAVIRNDSGAFATRQLLAGELKRGHDRLAGKKVVVWEFAIRELANGDWKLLDMTPGAVPEETCFLTLDTPKTVSAAVLAVSAVPRPHTAPYKDHVVSLHLGDIEGNAQAVVYAVSMRDNVWTAAAKLRPGDTVRIRLEPWEARESEFGSWNRSEFDDESLLLAEPLFGEILPDK